MSRKNQDFGYAIPGQSTPAIPTAPEQNNSAQSGTGSGDALPNFASMTKEQIKAYDAAYGSYRRLLGGKPITWFWLMNHYSKANADAYKAQKAARKSPAGAPADIPVTSNMNEPPAVFSGSASQVPQHQPSPQPKSSDQTERLSHSYEQPQEPAQDYFDRTVFIHRDNMPAQQNPDASLVCLGFQQTVSITKVPFRIGRARSNIDLCIPDNKTVGRMHAEITCKERQYYIRDMGSVNHVFLDGVQIQENCAVPLRNGVRILLGDEEFIFRLEQEEQR